MVLMSAGQRSTCTSTTKQDLLVSGFEGLKSIPEGTQREALAPGTNVDERVFAFSPRCWQVPAHPCQSIPYGTTLAAISWLRLPGGLGRLPGS